MPGKAYSAGTVFLQVVPSYRNFMDQLRRDAPELERTLSDYLDRGLEEGARTGGRKASKILETEMGKAGEKAGKESGEEYSDAFAYSVQRGLSDAQRRLKPIKVALDDTESKRKIDDLQLRLKRLGEGRIGVDLTAKEALDEVAKIRFQLQTLKVLAKDIDVQFDVDKASAGLRSLERQVKALKPNLDFKDAERSLGVFERTLRDRLTRALATLGTQGGQQVDELRRRLESLRDQSVDVNLNTGDAIRELTELRAILALVTSIDPDIGVRVNSAGAQRELAEILALVKTVDGTDAEIDVKTDRARAGGDAAANAFRAFNGVLLASVTLGSALVPVLAAVGGGLLLVGAAATGAAAGVGVLALGMSGIGDAVSALGDQADEAAQDTVAASRSIRDASQGVEDAERSLARTRQSAAWAAEDASRRVASAQREAASAVQDALQSQADAERRLADAQRDARQAQEDLREARRLAQQDLDDIADRVRQNALDERQAVVDLFNARINYRNTMADPGATNLEREEASIQLERARIRLEEIRETETELARERRRAAREGVEGTERVQTAQDALVAALEAQRDAQRAVGEASRRVDEARVEGARRVAEALRAQQRVQQSSAQSIADAQRAVTRSQQRLADTMHDTGVVGSTSAQKVEEALGKLSPAGQRFARYIHSLRDDFYALRAVAQEGMLPGFQRAIQLIVGRYGPGFTRFVGSISEVIGALGIATAKSLRGDVWSKFFGTFRDLAPVFLGEFGQSMLNWFEVLASLMTIAAPFARRLSAALLGISERAADFMASSEGAEMWSDFFGYVERVGPIVTDFFSSLFGALRNIGEALAPVGELVLGLVTDFLDWIATMDPKHLRALIMLIFSMVAAFQVAQAAIFIVTVVMMTIVTTAALVAGGIVIAIGALVWLYTESETFQRIVHGAFSLIGSVATWLFKNVLKPGFNGFVALLRFVGKIAQWLWQNILGPVFRYVAEDFMGMVDNIKWIWTHILWPVFKALGQIAWGVLGIAFKIAVGAAKLLWIGFTTSMKAIWENVLKPVFDVFMDLIGDDLVRIFRKTLDWIEGAWEGLKDILKLPIKFFIEVIMNKGLIRGYNKLADVFGMDPVDDIALPPGFNRGGVYPGYTPGRDIGYVGVSGGEAIMRPEWTVAIGEDEIERMNRAARLGGVHGVQRYLGGFARGGVAWPLPGQYNMTTPYGVSGPMWSSGYHTGADFRAPTGTPISAIMAGRVISNAWSSWGGNMIQLMHTGRYETWYAHMSAAIARLGSLVNMGQVIGYVGETGNTTGPHLHLEAHTPSGNTFDPMTILGPDGGSLPGGRGGAGVFDQIADWARNALASPLRWFKDRISGAMDTMTDRFGDNPFVNLLKEIPSFVLEKIVETVKGIIPFTDDGGATPTGGGPIVKMVRDFAAQQYGWTGSQWEALNWIVSRESSWNPTAQNPTSTAYGLFQFLDGTWSSVGGSKTSDPALQTKYGLKYIQQRYGSPMAARMFHEANGWYSEGGVVGNIPAGTPDNGLALYDTGGALPPGLTHVLNLTGGNEYVLTKDQYEGHNASGPGGINVDVDLHGSDLSPYDVADEVLFALRRYSSGGVYAGGRP